MTAEAFPDLCEETETESKLVFVVDSEEKVNWVLRTLGNLDAEIARVKAQADKMIKTLENNRQGLIYRFEADLQAFTAKRLAEGRGKSKTVHLLQGSLSFRRVPASLKVADETAAFAYAVAEGIDVAKKILLNKEEYRKYAEQRLEATGELLPGMERTEEREAFSIKFPKGKEGEETNGTTEE